VYGPLIELFTTEKKFFKCVETTAGNSLFHVVVDNVETASKMIEYLQQVKAGRITFIPLAQLREQHVDYPVSSDVFPMIKKLRYDPKFSKAIQQVFGKTLVTRSLAVATENARSHNLDAITLDGDQVNKKGALTGGFIDRKRSRIEAQLEVASHQSKFTKTTVDVTEIRTSLQSCDQGITRLISQIQKLQHKRDHLRQQQQQQTHAVTEHEKQMTQLLETIDKKSKEVEVLENSIDVQEAKIKAVTSEMGGELTKKLTAAEETTLKKLQGEQDELNENLIKVSAQRTKVETQKSVLQNSLNTNLRKRQDELRLQVESEETTMDAERLEEEKYILATLTDEVAELRRQIKATEADVEAKTQRQATLQTTLNQLKSKEDEANREVANQSKSIEKLLSQRSVYAKRKNDATNKIRELGALPADAYSAHQKKTVSQLIEKLEKVNKKLSKYEHVNKKAIDQFVSFQQQRVDLMARKKEQDSGRAAIMDLIAHLDQQKDEAIQRTFKGIAKNFSQVFAKLVPGGKGTLVIYTKKQKDDDDNDDDDDDENADSSNRSAKKAKTSAAVTSAEKSKQKKKKGVAPMSSSLYTGVGISVSFAGVKQNMMQLSGGQQCVVALTLIFAIQRCDPSPFYFFDEIDAALDAVYRTSIANMIHEQSKDTQFITTTFRPEMVAVAEKFYGVSFQNKASKVTEITQQEAKQLILLVERESRQ
jgi:structural maintenance of chromosome 3 (chondroitin sulfate proteoglycan 6)